MNRLLIFGLGYSGTAIAEAARLAAFSVTGTTRAGAPGSIPFDAAESAIESATHLLTTAAPNQSGPNQSSHDQFGHDPVLARYATAIAAASNLRWIGYLSGTVVYGDQGGNWVDEDTPTVPAQARGQRRVAAEAAWASFADRYPVDIFRLAGIYGPDRSAFDDLRSGRIHRDDIARAVVTAMLQDRPPGRRILNLSDDEPSESAAVVTEAASLLGVALPPEVTFEDALPTMNPMARSFWSENRKVSSAKTKTALGIEWTYPTYREGLRAILLQERGNSPL